MPGAERVVLAFGAAGEAREPVLLAQGADAVAAAGQHLVRIGLVANVPDQPVIGSIEHGMERHRQFDHAEPGAEMPAGHRNGVDDFGAQFAGKLAQVVARQRLEVRRGGDLVEQRSQRLVHEAISLERDQEKLQTFPPRSRDNQQVPPPRNMFNET